MNSSKFLLQASTSLAVAVVFGAPLVLVPRAVPAAGGPRAVSLTEAGVLLLRHAEAIVAAFDRDPSGIGASGLLAAPSELPEPPHIGA